MFRYFKNLFLVVLFLAIALPGFTQTSGVTSDIINALTTDDQGRYKPIERGNDSDGFGRYYHFIFPAHVATATGSVIGVRGWDDLSVQVVQEIAGPVLLTTSETSLSATVKLIGNLYPGGTPTVTSGLKTWGVDDPDLTDGGNENTSWYVPIGIKSSPVTTWAYGIGGAVSPASSVLSNVTSEIRWPGMYSYDVHGIDRVGVRVTGNSATQHVFIRLNTAPNGLRGEN